MSWAEKRQSLKSSFRKRTGRKPSADETQELCLRLFIRDSQSDDSKLSFWRAVGDVIDSSREHQRRQDREAIAVGVHGMIRDPIPSNDDRRSKHQRKQLARIKRAANTELIIRTIRRNTIGGAK